ncbi:MAG: AAA family ATPase [bacterium]|nr:AAA family ATPase [bacterium]
MIGAVEIVRNVTDQIRLTEECATLRREVRRQVDFDGIVTQSKAIKELLRIVQRIAPTNSPVLLTGESGAGKELFAKAIWQNSDRREQPFVPVNCAAIPKELIESELFGHLEGAFTGANRAREGLIERADGGTLFLDEIGELPMTMQPKLLRFLQEGECRRVGADQTRQVDVRIIAATNRDIEEAVAEGVFRADLYYRIAVIPMYLPPLRDRPEDTAMLATHLLQRLCDQHHRAVTGIAPEALGTMLRYPWPGNARELENVIEYALHLTDDGTSIGVEQLPPQLVRSADEPTVTEFARAGALVTIEEYTKQAVVELQNDHKEEEIARLLGISRKTLWEKRKRWDLPRPGGPRPRHVS